MTQEKHLSPWQVHVLAIEYPKDNMIMFQYCHFFRCYKWAHGKVGQSEESSSLDNGIQKDSRRTEEFICQAIQLEPIQKWHEEFRREMVIS